MAHKQPKQSRTQGSRSQKSDRVQGCGGQRGAAPQARERRANQQKRNANQQERRGQHERRGRSAHKRSSDMICGRRAVAEALAAGIPLQRAWVQPAPEGELAHLATRLTEAGAELEQVPARELDRMAQGAIHQGIVVQIAPFSYTPLAELIAQAPTGDALIVVLDHVVDEGNLGAIIRSCEVVGASGVVIASARAAGVGLGAYKTSAGAALHIPVAQVPNIARALEELKAAGFWTAAATEHATQSVWDAPVAGRMAWVMGSEHDGVSRLVLDRCDFTCSLPQRGTIESLNVAQAACVLCYEWLRRVEQASASQQGV